jgi:RHS repeat-associated protein
MYGMTNTYTFDGNGNRKTYNSINSTFDNQDKLLTQGATTYTWDALGNRIGKSDGTVYVHDGMGALKSWTKAGTTISYELDGLQRRVSRSKNGAVTARYVYDGQYRIVAETVSGSRFIYATYSHSPDLILRNGNTYKVVKNHLGSVRHIVNVANGQIIQSIDYDAWGNVVSDSNPGFQPFGFAGGLVDADTGLTHFGFRDYDPSSGTWTSRDPIRLAGGDTNLYAYVGNDPVGRIDPSGLQPGDSFPIFAAWFFWLQMNPTGPNFPQSDKVAHCMANCNSAQKGDAPIAATISVLREATDLLRHYLGDPKKKNEGPEASAEDMQANCKGLVAGMNPFGSCVEACRGYLP